MWPFNKKQKDDPIKKCKERIEKYKKDSIYINECDSEIKLHYSDPHDVLFYINVFSGEYRYDIPVYYKYLEEIFKMSMKTAQNEKKCWEERLNKQLNNE